jgi:hypothetical protein
MYKKTKSRVSLVSAPVVTVCALIIFLFVLPTSQLKAQSVMTIAQMHAQIIQLMEIVNQLQARLALENNNAVIKIGGNVQATTNLLVRNNPSGAILGIVSGNMSGVVVDGPKRNGSYEWWKIKYENGISGWSAADWLRGLAPKSSVTSFGDMPVDDISVPKNDNLAPAPTPTRSSDLKGKQIFDLVSELKPESDQKELLVVADINDLGCRLRYTKSDSELKGIAANQLRSTFFQSEWILAEWYKLQNLCHRGKIDNVNDSLQFFVEDPENSENQMKAVAFLPNVVRMTLKSVDIYRILYGAEYYSQKNPENHPLMPTWPHLLLQKQFPFTKLSDHESLDLKVKAKLRYVGIKTNKIAEVGPMNTTTDYDPKIHSTHFRFVFPIQWRDPSCKRMDVNDPVCKHYGRYVHVPFLLFDERYEFKNKGITNFDPTSQQWMYAVDLRDVLEGGHSLTHNPFKEVNKSAEMNVDLKKLFIDIIFELEDKALGQNMPGRFLPPRLVTNGVEETDEEYLAHFGFAGFNIGYEANGLSHMVYDIEDFKLTAVEKID